MPEPTSPSVSNAPKLSKWVTVTYSTRDRWATELSTLELSPEKPWESSSAEDKALKKLAKEVKKKFNKTNGYESIRSFEHPVVRYADGRTHLNRLLSQKADSYGWNVRPLPLLESRQ